MITKQGFTPSEGLMVASRAHSSPEQFGKVMSLVKPRIGVGYHFYNDFDTAPEVLQRVRKIYSGPLALGRRAVHGRRVLECVHYLLLVHHTATDQRAGSAASRASMYVVRSSSGNWIV